MVKSFFIRKCVTVCASDLGTMFLGYWVCITMQLPYTRKKVQKKHNLAKVEHKF